MAVIHPEAADLSAVTKAALKAAEELGLPASVVATSSDGIWGMALVVPDEVADRFGKHMESSQAPIKVEQVTIEVVEADEPEVTEEKPVKRGPGRPRKVVAAKPETEE